MIEWFRHIASTPAGVPIVAAWFAAAASVLAALVTLATATVTAGTTARVARRSVYINSVTTERAKWIDALRRSIADYSGAAERVIARRSDPEYEKSAEWAADVQSLRTNLSNLKMRLNPRETAVKNLIIAAAKVDQAARLHRWTDVDLAGEIMVRHSQWILKFEWNRVKLEAASGRELRRLKREQNDLQTDYDAFLGADGSLHRLDAIGAGEKEVVVALLRSEMDTGRPAGPRPGALVNPRRDPTPGRPEVADLLVGGGGFLAQLVAGAYAPLMLTKAAEAFGRNAVLAFNILCIPLLVAVTAVLGWLAIETNARLRYSVERQPIEATVTLAAGALILADCLSQVVHDADAGRAHWRVWGGTYVRLFWAAWIVFLGYSLKPALDELAARRLTALKQRAAAQSRHRLG